MGRKKNRIRLSKRQKLLIRDEYKCLCCGETKLELLTKDHVVPKALGGKSTIDNLQMLCKSCNLIKGTQIIDYRKTG